MLFMMVADDRIKETIRDRGNDMARKLFCEISPLTYKISTQKEILKRNIRIRK